MAKFDVKSACYLLGMCWEGKFYVDASLSFGLRSAPKIFTAVANALEWIFYDHQVEDVWHYLDTLSPWALSECQANIITVELYKRLEVPLADEKLVGACTSLT